MSIPVQSPELIHPGDAHVHGPGCSHDHDHYYEEPFVRGEPKIGRNDPCPCNSGKKFKKCCIKK